MSNYNHQKKHHGIPGLDLVFASVLSLTKKKGNSHKKKSKK